MAIFISKKGEKFMDAHNNKEDLPIDPRLHGMKFEETREGRKGDSVAFETAKGSMKVIPQVVMESMQKVADPKIWQAILEKMGLSKPKETEKGRA